jgi:hypothetical protein
MIPSWSDKAVESLLILAVATACALVITYVVVRLNGDLDGRTDQDGTRSAVDSDHGGVSVVRDREDKGRGVTPELWTHKRDGGKTVVDLSKVCAYEIMDQYGGAMLIVIYTHGGTVEIAASMAETDSFEESYQEYVGSYVDAVLEQTD